MLHRYTVLACWVCWGAVACAKTGAMDASDAHDTARQGSNPGVRHTPTESFAIDALVLADARVGQPFEQPITVHGGSPPYAWSIDEGVPGWLTLAVGDDGNARLIGTPVHSGTFAIDVQVETPNGERAEGTWSLRVKPKRWAVYMGGADPASDSVGRMTLELDPHTVVPPKPSPLVDATNPNLQWSSDGAWLAGFAEAGAVRLWDMGGSQPAAPQLLTPSQSTPQSVFSISPVPPQARFLVLSHGRDPSCPTCLDDPASFVYVLDASAAADSQLTEIEGLGHDPWVDWSPDGTSLLASIRDADTNTQYRKVLLIDLDARERAPLQMLPAGNWDARWSPDGRWLAAQGTDSNQQGGLFLFNLASTRRDAQASPWRVPDDVSSEPDSMLGWSPDGAWLLLRGSDPTVTEVHLLDMRADTPGKPLVLVLQGGQDGRELDAAWSPDSQRFVVISNTPQLVELSVFEIAGARKGPIWKGRLPQSANRRTADATWSPDSRRLMLISNGGAPSPVDVFVFEITGAHEGPIWQKRLQDSQEPPSVAWTAAGLLVLRDGGSLFVHTLAEGSQPQEIAQDVGATSLYVHPSELLLSPDRRQLVYTTNPVDDTMRAVTAHLVTFGPPTESLPVMLNGRPIVSLPGSPSAVNWLSDSSGLLAFTGVTDTGAAPEICFSACGLEYLFLGADGEPQSSHSVDGRAEARYGFMIQP